MNQQKINIIDIAENSLQGEASPEENLLLTNWVLGDKKLNQWVVDEISSMSPIAEDVDLDPICQEIMSNKRKRKRVLLNLMGAAAAVVAGFVLCFVWMINSTPEDTNLPLSVRTMEGEKSRITLPDGSFVMLNSLTQLTYSYNKETGTRNVKLSGEAWFDVRSDEEHPFIVDCDNLQVECLGTEFNVVSYPDDETVTVVLKDGKINATSTRDKVEMRPGMLLTYDRTSGSVNTDMVTASDHCDWKKGEIYCNDITLDKLFKRLARTYGATINVATPALREERVYGMILEGDLRESIAIVCQACDAEYTIENGNNVTIYKPTRE